MVVAQLVELRFVVPAVVGSSPIDHPSLFSDGIYKENQKYGTIKKLFGGLLSGRTSTRHKVRAIQNKLFEVFHKWLLFQERE